MQLPTHSSRRPFLLAVLAVACVCVAPGALGSNRGHGTIHGHGAVHGSAGLEPRAALLTQQVRALAESLQAQPAHRSGLTRRLAELSRQRQQALTALLGPRPRRAAQLVLPAGIRHTLRSVPGAAVESSVLLSGTFRVWHRDDFEHPGRGVYLDQIVTASGKTLTLHGADSRVTVRLTFARLKPGALMSVRGFALGGHVLATDVWTPSARTLAAAAATATTGPIGVAVIVATFADSATPVDTNAIRSNFQGNPGHDVTSYFDEASYGKMSVVPSFFGPYPLSTTSSTGCSSNPNQALIAAAAANVNFAQYSRLIFVYNCPWSNFGSATSVGPVSTPQGTVQAAQIALDSGSATNLYSVVHELSHTLGSFNDHAASYVCLPDTFVAPARFDASCASAEYGDPFDSLGGPPTGSLPQLDPLHKAKAGWFDAAQYPTVTASGTFTLGPYEQSSATGQPLALNIPRGQSGTAFTVEYRQPIGYDAWMSSPVCQTCTVTQGASIRLVAGAGGSGGGSDTQLLDTTPGTIPSSYYYPIEDARDGALLAGRTFTDPEYGISIKTVSASSSGLTVQVTVPAQTCVHGTPTVSAPSPATITGEVGQTSTSTVTLTNTDSAGCPANTFRYFPPSSSTVNIVASPDYLTLAPGASATISLGVSALPVTTAGSYGFSPADGVGAGTLRSNSLGTGNAIVSGLTYQLTSAADTTAPSAPSGLTARAPGSSVVSVSWSPASDNVGVVGYRVARAGAVFTTGTNSLVDNAVAPGAAYTYSVQAFDRRGNLSPATTVLVTTPGNTDSSAPTAPTVTAVAGDHSLRVSWTASSDNVGLAYYRIFPCLVPQCIVPASARSFTADGLTSRTKYDIQVLGVDGDGNTSSFGYGKYPVYTAAAGTTAPSQPQHLISPAGSYHRVDLSWAPSTDDTGVASYAVYRNNRQIATVTSTSYTDTLVGCPSEYYVQAVDGDGSISAPSARVWFPAPSSPSSDSSPPTASVTSPADGTTVSGSVGVTASASDDAGVTTVQLYVDGTLRATVTSAPYSFAWDTTSVPDGRHWLYVRAYDAAGNYGTTGVTTVTVDNGVDTTPPAVSLTAPTGGTSVSGSVSLAATATDEVGVAKVEFSVDGALLASAASAPYAATWDASNAAPGTHTITATAYDAAGNSATASVSVTHPASADTTPPTVSITAPADGTSVSGTVQVQASASDGVGVTKIELSVDGALTGTLTAGPWSFGLNTATLANGTHKLVVKGYDAAGNNSSAQVSIGVAAPADATAPNAPSSLRAAIAATTQIALTWTASKDNVGVVAYVVSRDGVEVGESALPTFLDSGLAPASSHTYRVVARDAAGNSSPASSALSAKTVATTTATTGTFSGLVYNAQGKPLANAVVQVTVDGTVKSAKTNNTGLFKFTRLPPGTYEVTTALTGYGTASADVTGLAAQTVVLVTVLSP